MTRSQLNKNDIDAIILCGGKGERLNPIVSNKQKCVADILGKPFLDILIDDLISKGIRRIIFCAGYLSEQISDYANSRNDFDFEISIEKNLLGTGGALKNAAEFIKSEHFLVLNGDSFCPFDFNGFYKNHLDNKAIFSIVLSKIDNVSGYSSVEIDENGKLTGYIFHERKNLNTGGLINAGIYFMRKDIFFHMPDRVNFSLEHDFFPNFLDKNCYGFITDGEVIDIGTPERYLMAQKFFSNNN